MAPDGQVRLQASGIRLDHSLLSRRAKGRLYAPFAHPELFEPIFAAAVTRRVNGQFVVPAGGRVKVPSLRVFS